MGTDGRLQFKGDIPRGGSVSMKVDANKGVIQIKGKKLDLGALAGTDFELHLAIGPDFEETVTVRMTLKKDRRSY